MNRLSDTPASLRQAIREGGHTGPTAGMAPGWEQANLVILPFEHAPDFSLFCQRNPRACPVLDVTDPGDPEPKRAAPGSDLRSDLPRYRVFRDGQLHDEPTDIGDLWRDDLVGFLLGCSFTFEAAMSEEGIPVRHVEQRCNVPMFITNIRCRPAGVFSGPMVVSMRPVPAHLVDRAFEVTGRYPRSHGAPIHAGDPEALGIVDLARPDFGDLVSVEQGDVPLFWACGVTPQVALTEARLPLAMTHAPGHMFLTDIPSPPGP